MDPATGYSSETNTFHSLRPPVSLPPSNHPLSIAEYVFSLLRSPNTAASHTVLIDASSGRKLSYSDFLRQTRALARSIQSRFPSLVENNGVAFVLSPTSLHVPVLYFALLSLGVVVSPANPLSTPSELAHMVTLSKSALAFATSATSNKLPQLPLGTVLMDSPEFIDMLEGPASYRDDSPDRRVIRQSDPAAILYSSGTTGRVKGVELSHRNYIALITVMYHNKFSNGISPPSQEEVSLLMLPLFHVFGFFMLIRLVAMGETAVILERFDLGKMLAAIQNHSVSFLPVSPPLVVAMAKSDLVTNYDLRSLKLIACGGAPLGREVAMRFKARFPNVDIIQGYGLTETSGGTTGMVSAEETDKYGSAGRLYPTVEAKIVDPESGKALPPGHRGELWLRGPLIMKGYVGDSSATSATLDSEGWLRTGDLCYFDSDGFLFIVDRLKELIKYNAYQVPPAELEHLLHSIPDVADAAVIPYPDEEAGQIPMAYIVRKPGSNITQTQIMDIIAKQVAPYKKIRRVAFINSIPKSAAGKILRRELVSHAASAKL